MLCHKNRLMRCGLVEEADALAQRIGKEIARRSKTRLKSPELQDSDQGHLGGRPTANWLETGSRQS